MEDYDIITRLGGGSFADVYKAIDKNTGEYVAIKVLKEKYSKWEDCLTLREVKSLQKLHENHLAYQQGVNNIIKIKQIIFIKESGTLNLIFEYMEKDLFELMKARSPKKLNENQIRNITYQTLQGLAFMHKYGFFHRDMKPENLLVIGDTFKIADFGLAREIRSMPPYTEYVSTRYYRAPECILKSTNYNSPVDIWGLACIMAEMYLHPQPLFFGNNEKEVLFKICSIMGTPTHSVWSEGLQQASKVGIRFPNCQGMNLAQVIPQASADAIDLLYQMLKWDPNKRATAHHLLQHPFFTRYSISNSLGFDSGNNRNVVASGGEGKDGVKKYSNKKNAKTNKAVTSKEDDDMSNMLNDTEGFDKCKEHIYIFNVVYSD